MCKPESEVAVVLVGYDCCTAVAGVVGKGPKKRHGRCKCWRRDVKTGDGAGETGRARSRHAGSGAMRCNVDPDADADDADADARM